MQECRTGGMKEFIFSVIWSVLILFFGRYIIFMLPAYKITGAIFTVILFCILGFFVLTRYAAVFTYTLKGYNLRINRRIGGRNKELEIKLSEAESICKHKPPVHLKRRCIYMMCTSVFSCKKRRYIVYRHGGIHGMIVFEPSREMFRKISELMQSAQTGKE